MSKNFKLFYLMILFLVLGFIACSKKDAPIDNGGTPPNNGNSNDTIPIQEPVDPPLAATQGFFLDNWQPKTYVAPQYTDANVPPTSLVNSVTIDMANVITKIPVTIFGHNANNWMTPMYNQPAFMSQLTDLNPHVLRWPAGSASDAFFWNCTNQPPADAPAQVLDANGNRISPGYIFGKTTNSWQATQDNYYQVLQQTNSVGLITVNYAYARYGTSANPVAASAHLAADWVRYDNGRTLYWEIGNENYANWELGYRIDVTANKDGQPEFLNGQLYAQHFKVYADSMRKAAAEVGKTIYIGAVMYESNAQSSTVNTTKTWNSTMIPEVNTDARTAPDFYIGHNYMSPYGQNSNASVILNAALAAPAQMMTFMTGQMTAYGGKVKPLIMSEWNMWAQDSMQMVSNVSGTFAAIVQCEDLKNKYGLSARWDLLNGWANGNDHGLFSDGTEPGVSKWTARPSFYYMYFLQKCFGDRMVSATVGGTTTIAAYASSYTTGQCAVALFNISGTPQTVPVTIKNFKMGDRFYWYELSGGDDHGSFSRKVYVNGDGPTQVAGGPADYATVKAKSALTSSGVRVSVPAWSGVFVMVDTK